MSYSRTLTCMIGDHPWTWTTASTRGRPPHSCEDHREQARRQAHLDGQQRRRDAARQRRREQAEAVEAARVEALVQARVLELLGSVAGRSTAA